MHALYIVVDVVMSVAVVVATTNGCYRVAPIVVCISLCYTALSWQWYDDTHISEVTYIEKALHWSV